MRHQDLPSTRTWAAPRSKHPHNTYKPKPAVQRARRKLCPHSPFWSDDLDIPQHRREWEAGRERHLAHQIHTSVAAALQNLSLSPSRPITTIAKKAVATAPSLLREAFDGKQWTTHHSPVLTVETIFTPNWRLGKDTIAPWPSKAEMKYEGDDRVSTDKLHRRFLSVPRMEDEGEEEEEDVEGGTGEVEGSTPDTPQDLSRHHRKYVCEAAKGSGNGSGNGNGNNNWQTRIIIKQYDFEEFYYPVPTELDVFLKWNRVDELEVDDVEGERMLGRELMRLLEPEDQWV